MIMLIMHIIRHKYISNIHYKSLYLKIPEHENHGIVVKIMIIKNGNINHMEGLFLDKPVKFLNRNKHLNSIP